jgi:hypothetical protein
LRRLRRDLKHLAPQTSTNGSEARQKKRMLSVYG